MDLDLFVNDLLHIDDGKNKLIDLGDGDDAYFLEHGKHETNRSYFLELIRKRIGKPANTLLNGSSDGKAVVTADANVVEWRDASGASDPEVLSKFIDKAYDDMSYRGVNTFFLGLGTVEWKFKIGVKDRVGKTPLLIFPAVLTRFGKDKSIYLGFLDEEIYLNPCFVAKLESMHGKEAAAGLPHPDGDVPKDDPIELENIGAGDTYFAKVAEYLAKFTYDDGTPLFDFDGNGVAVSRYSHDDICMYYDIRRNREKIENHPLVRRVFGESYSETLEGGTNVEPLFVMPKDAVQTEMIREVVNGKSMVIKGPPGTGKTLTIANMIAALLAEGKSILLASEKTAALSEVYAKLPDNLRKFAMLLDTETEKQAAKFNPNEIRRDFNAMLRAKKEYDNAVADRARTDLSHAERDAASANAAFIEHYNIMFGIPVVDGTYYDAIDAYCEHDLPMIKFCDQNAAMLLSDEQYRDLYKHVEKAGECFDRMTENGAFGIEKCPWYPTAGKLPTDTESAYSDYQAIAKLAAKVAGDGKKHEFGDDFPIVQVLYLADSGFTEADLDTAAAVESAVASELSSALVEYEKCRAYEIETCVTGEEAKEISEKLAALKTDGRLAVGGIKLIHDNNELLSRITCDGEKLKKISEEYTAKLDEAIAHKENALAFFRTGLTIEEEKKIAYAAEKLAPFASGGDIGFLDKLAGNRAAKLMAKYSYLQNVEFDETVKATLEYGEYLKGIAGLEKFVQELHRIARVQLDKEQVEVLIALGKLSEGRNIKQLCEEIKSEYDTIVACAEKLGMYEDYTVDDLRANCNAAIVADRLHRAVEAVGIKSDDIRRAAHGVFAARAIYDCRSLKDMHNDLRRSTLSAVLGLDSVAKANIRSLIKSFAEFGSKHFENSYSANVDALTYAELSVFDRQATDRNIMNAAREYFENRAAECVVEIGGEKLVVALSNFLRPFECGKKTHGEYTFGDFFKHSVYGLAVSGVETVLGDTRNGMGDRVIAALELRQKAEDSARVASRDIIESRCLGRINPKDPAFAFLNEERNASENLRRFFRNHGSAILKLKKCFMLSPSTVSVLLRGDEFGDFDVVIIDEASQSEPTGLLPALFRSKQCVLVGDEFQMPPIRHFTTVSEKSVVTEDGDIEMLDPSMSALGLAVHNKSFEVRRLDCHYRSNTEALIAYSQARFYPDMHTFPAPVLIRDGLGFIDVYTPDGRSDGGVNKVEAQEVVKALERHFEKYYDEESGVLSQSVGIIAFGVKQVDCIKRLVEKNVALREKISRALRNFDDVPEKLVFYKTIETVQGQESKHTIISLTYGRNADGKVEQKFGEMNRNALGQCIFNVAVTRAQSSVTVIHSVQAEDITQANLAFIRDYLLYVRRYCGDNIREQFVSKEFENSFMHAVGEYIVSLGIPRERVVYGYGGTEGSVRIPVAVLDSELNSALLGVWCETAHRAGDDYYDCNMGRYASLVARGWNFVRVYAHDWIDNAKATKETIAAAVDKFVKIG